jgi:hypothetical protein
MSTLRLAILSMVTLLLGACGDGHSSSPSETVAQVGGNWTGTTILTGVTGGECIGALLQGTVGSNAGVSVSIQQTGASFTATINSQATGLSCSYSGSVSGSAVMMNLTSCQANAILGIHCPNGALRDMVLIGSSLTGALSGDTIAGTEAETWNVVVAATTSGVGTLGSSESFTIHR